MAYSDRELEKLAEEAQDPGDPPIPAAPAPEPTGGEAVPESGEVEVDMGGEDEGVVIIQNPETGQFYMAQELTTEDLADLGFELVPEDDEKGSVE